MNWVQRLSAVVNIVALCAIAAPAQAQGSGAVFAGAAPGARIQVAVAANFFEPAKEIGALFKAQSGVEAVFSFGSSGQLYAQIAQEAPFDIFLSADDARPREAIAAGFAVAGSRFTYAIGRLALWGRGDLAARGGEALAAGGFSKLAIANPGAAPYGVAAIETMKALKLYATLQPKIVQGKSIGQAFQFVDTGNAELGFVALSQLAGQPAGSRWIVPQDYYTPIRQDAVLLQRGADKPAAAAFLAFLRGAEAQAVIEKFGYAVERGR